MPSSSASQHRAHEVLHGEAGLRFAGRWVERFRDGLLNGPRKRRGVCAVAPRSQPTLLPHEPGVAEAVLPCAAARADISFGADHSSSFARSPPETLPND